MHFAAAFAATVGCPYLSCLVWQHDISDVLDEIKLDFEWF
jgi:hypothetical protein